MAYAKDALGRDVESFSERVEREREERRSNKSDRGTQTTKTISPTASWARDNLGYGAENHPRWDKPNRDRDSSLQNTVSRTDSFASPQNSMIGFGQQGGYKISHAVQHTRSLLGGGVAQNKSQTLTDSGNASTLVGKRFSEISSQSSPIDYMDTPRGLFEKGTRQVSYAAPRRMLDGRYDPKQANAYVQGVVARDFYDRETKGNLLNHAGTLGSRMFNGVGSGITKGVTAMAGQLGISKAGDITNAITTSKNYQNLPEGLKGLYQAHYNKLAKDVDDNDDFYSSGANAARSIIGLGADIFSQGGTMGQGSTWAKTINRHHAILDALQKAAHPEAKAVLKEHWDGIYQSQKENEAARRMEGGKATGLLELMRDSYTNSNQPSGEKDHTLPSYVIPGIANLWSGLNVQGYDYTKYLKK